jgi:hypothetical protein
MTVFQTVMRWIRTLAGRVLWRIFEGWVRTTGRKIGGDDMAWIDGYISQRATVGPEILEEVAARHDVLLEWSKTGGLLPDFGALDGVDFDPAQVDAAVHAFYERTAAHRYGVTPRWSSPLAWLASGVIATAGRAIDQFNLPLSADEAREGMSNEVVHLRDRQCGERRETCWLRRSKVTGKVIYAGFYGVCTLPDHLDTPCVKVVFPLPDGYICVLLKPTVHPDGGLDLISKGDGFGDPGFYWVQGGASGQRRAKYIKLHESIHVYADEDGELLTDHTFSLWGTQFLWLRYDIEPLQHACGHTPAAHRPSTHGGDDVAEVGGPAVFGVA